MEREDGFRPERPGVFFPLKQRLPILLYLVNQEFGF